MNNTTDRETKRDREVNIHRQRGTRFDKQHQPRQTETEPESQRRARIQSGRDSNQTGKANRERYEQSPQAETQGEQIGTETERHSFSETER